MYQIRSAFDLSSRFKTRYRKQKVCCIRRGAVGNIQPLTGEKMTGMGQRHGLSGGIDFDSIHKKSPFHPRICGHTFPGA